MYKVLDQPHIYRAAQALFAPGADKLTKEKISVLLAGLEPAQKILDVGCGPASWLWTFGIHPVGLDITPEYVDQFCKKGEIAHVGSAAEIPFKDEEFDGVWSIGLLHHLDDETARKAIDEMQRVCRKGGYVVIIDAVLPIRFLTRPVAHILRKVDRGRFVRRMEEHKLLFSSSKWEFDRFLYAWNGLECTCSILAK